MEKDAGRQDGISRLPGKSRAGMSRERLDPPWWTQQKSEFLTTSFNKAEFLELTWPELSKLNTSRHRRQAEAVSLKKICCFFCCPFGKITKSPVVGRWSQKKSCLPRLADFKTRCCREWKEKFSAPPVAKTLFPGLLRQKKIWKVPVQRVAGGLSKVAPL